MNEQPIFLKNAYREHWGGFRPIRDANAITVNLTFDILDGCEHHCPGCFVKKRNSYFNEGDDLALLQLIEDLRSAGYSMDELNIGPTDIFSADNFEYLLKNQTFVEMANEFNLTVVTTLMDDSDAIAKKIAAYEVAFPHRDRRVEVFVMLDLKKYIGKDWFYLNQLYRNIKLLADWNVFFLVNVYSEDMFDEMDLPTLGQRLLDDFGTKLRINPSYFRGTSSRHVSRYAVKHKEMLERNVDDKSIERVFLNMADIYFNSFSTLNLSYAEGELSVMVFLYEGIPQIHDRFKVAKRDGKYHLEDIQQTVDRLFVEQYEYAEQTHHCADCRHLSSCVSRNVLSYMDTRAIKDCLLPQQLFRDASRAVELELRNHD